MKLMCLAVPACLVLAAAAHAAPPPQATTFEQTIADLGNQDPAVRLRAVRLLRDTPYPEAVVPLASAVLDREDQIQLEAIAAELNIFLAERSVARKHVAMVVEVRSRAGAEAAFESGRKAVGAPEGPRG